MNKKPDQKTGKVHEENVFVPNISSDSNANQNRSNNIKDTGAISKTKNTLQNTVNGVPELKYKVNNNLLDAFDKNSESNLLNNIYKNDELVCSSAAQVNGFTYSPTSEADKSPVKDHSRMNGTKQDGLNLAGCLAGPSSSCMEKIEVEVSKQVESDEYSSDTGNDELSCCDDCCIYTYKGDVADLPRSFMNLEPQENGEDGSQAGSRGSSPEMDFLEMDFDPGPSCDAESDESSVNIDLKDCDDIENSDNFNHDEIKNSAYQKDFNNGSSTVTSNNYNYDYESKPSCSKNDDFLLADVCMEPQPSTSRSISNENTVELSNYSLNLTGSKSQEFIKLRNYTEAQPCCSKSESNIFTAENRNEIQNNLSQLPPATNVELIGQNVNSETSTLEESYIENDFEAPWIPKDPSERTKACAVSQDVKSHHNSGGDLILWNENTTPSTSPESRLNTSSSLYHSTMEKKLVLDKQPSNHIIVVQMRFYYASVEKTMIWTEQEAAMKQTTQISTSACGATAVINVLKALGHNVPPNDRIIECVPTRLRANNSSLVKYLLSRSVAGSTHCDIISGLEKLSEGKIYARFFSTYPERYVNLTIFLAYWIKLGAVPVVTLNLQRGAGSGSETMPDSWHHQMVFGAGPHGLYMTNPLERVAEGQLWPQLVSDSELLVRREDTISRFDNTSLREMTTLKDLRWKRFNVVGQTANVVREHRLQCKILSRTHVRIPAAYKAGITLAMNAENAACEQLRTCPELALLTTAPLTDL